MRLIKIGKEEVHWLFFLVIFYQLWLSLKKMLESIAVVAAACDISVYTLDLSALIAMQPNHESKYMFFKQDSQRHTITSSHQPSLTFLVYVTTRQRGNISFFNLNQIYLDFCGFDNNFLIIFNFLLSVYWETKSDVLRNTSIFHWLLASNDILVVTQLSRLSVNAFFVPNVI